MERMSEALEKIQSVFDVLTDKEFYESSYGESRRAKKSTASNMDFFHVLIPGSSKNLYATYFHVNRVDFAMSPGFERFSSNISFTKRRPKDRYWEFRVTSENPDELYEMAYKLSLELMEYAIKMHPEYDPSGKWDINKKTINDPLPPKDIIKEEDGTIHYICGNCGSKYQKAPRCPECGQLVKE